MHHGGGDEGAHHGCGGDRELPAPCGEVRCTSLRCGEKQDTFPHRAGRCGGGPRTMQGGLVRGTSPHRARCSAMDLPSLCNRPPRMMQCKEFLGMVQCERY